MLYFFGELKYEIKKDHHHYPQLTTEYHIDITTNHHDTVAYEEIFEHYEVIHNNYPHPYVMGEELTDQTDDNHYHNQPP